MDVIKRLIALAILVGVLLSALYLPTTQAFYLPTTQANNLERLVYQVNVLTSEGRYTEAIPLAERMVELTEEKFGSEHIEVAAKLNDLGRLYFRQGQDIGKSIVVVKRALMIYQKAYGPNHLDVASTLNNLVILYDLQGYNQVEIEALVLRILDIYEKELGSDHPWFAIALTRLGTVFQKQGRYDESEMQFRKAIEIHEKTDGPDDLSVAMVLSYLANLYRDQGRLNLVESLYKRNLKIVEKAYGPNHPEVATSLSNLGSHYVTMRRNDEAEPLLRRALVINERLFGSNSLHIATALHNLSVLAESQGRDRDAESLLKRSLLIHEKELGRDHIRVAISLFTLAELYLIHQHYTDANSLFLRTLEIQENTLGSDHPDLAETFYYLAWLYLDQEKHPQALEWARKGTAVLFDRFVQNEMKSTSTMSERFQLEWALHAHMDLALHPNQLGSRPVLLREGFKLLQLARSSSAASAIGRMAARFATSERAVAELVREHQDAITKYQGLDAALLERLGRASKQRDRVQETKLRNQVTEIKSFILTLREEIKKRFPQYAELTSSEPLSLNVTQELLDGDEALLAMTRSWKGDQTHVFLIRPEKSVTYTVDLTVSQIEEMVAQLRSGFDSVTGRINAFDVGLAHELYRKLLSLTEPLLVGVDHLFVVPDGPLESLPFHLLVTEDPGEVSLPGLTGSSQRGFTIETDTTQVITDGDEGYQDIAWLAKRHAITTLPSVASLRALRVFAKRTEATEPFIGFGNPVLGGQTGESKGLQLASFYRGAVADVDEVRQLSSLPETEIELRVMAKYLGADDDAIYLRERATETKVKEVTLNQSKVVAFSTHGLVSGDLKGLAEPALVLTPPETGTEHDDGLLTASEVAQLKLDADWVILSACNTAAGDKPGATGLSGLAKAFFYAGARALLVSHWPVESNAATALTTNMFQVLKKNPLIGRAEALRQSMMTLASKPKTSHPFFWAPFVVVGEGTHTYR